MWAVSRKGRRAGILRGQAGVTLVELVVSATVLALMATTVLGGLLYGMTEARRRKLRAEAAAWVQAELDYLRVQGYSFLADDVAAGTRTLTQTGGYTTSSELRAARLPARCASSPSPSTRPRSRRPIPSSAHMWRISARRNAPASGARRCGESGMTLLEVLVVIGLMAVLAGSMSAVVGAAVRSKLIVAVRSADASTARQTPEG